MSACRCCGGARSATPTPAMRSSAFVDELLEAAGKDPVEGRLAMMKDKPRHAGVLRAVAELADWKGAELGRRPRPRRRRGRELQHLRRADRRDVDERRRHRACTRSGARSIAASRSIPTSSARRWKAASALALGHILFARADDRRGPSGRRQFRRLSLAAHRRDAGGRGHHRGVEREADAASASPACRRSDPRSPTPWRNSASGDRGNCRSCREPPHERRCVRC